MQLHPSVKSKYYLIEVTGRIGNACPHQATIRVSLATSSPDSSQLNDRLRRDHQVLLGLPLTPDWGCGGPGTSWRHQFQTVFAEAELDRLIAVNTAEIADLLDWVLRQNGVYFDPTPCRPATLNPSAKSKYYWIKALDRTNEDGLFKANLKVSLATDPCGSTELDKRLRRGSHILLGEELTFAWGATDDSCWRYRIRPLRAQTEEQLDQLIATESAEIAALIERVLSQNGVSFDAPEPPLTQQARLSPASAEADCLIRVEFSRRTDLEFQVKITCYLAADPSPPEGLVYPFKTLRYPDPDTELLLQAMTPDWGVLVPQSEDNDLPPNTWWRSRSVTIIHPTNQDLEQFAAVEVDRIHEVLRRSIPKTKRRLTGLPPDLYGSLIL